jgi:type I restriction enzyme S subunit
MPVLSSLVDIKGGGTPSKNKPEYWNGDIPWASVKDFKSSILSGASDYITQEGIDNSATNLIPKGNIIVPTRMALGKVAVNTVNLAINQDLKALIIKDLQEVDRDYLLRCIESKSVEIIRQGKGATVKGITLDILKNLDIPLPPLETQKQIAAVLEKADQLRKDCKQMEQELNSLAQSVFIDMFGDPVTNPKGWEECTLEDLTIMVTYGLTVRPKYHEEGVPLISARELRSGTVNFSGSPKISKEDFDRLSDKGCPKKDDILFSKTGSIGHCAIVESSQEFAVSQNAARIVVNKEKCHPKFILAFLRTDYFYNLANRSAKGNAVKDLQLGIMKKFPMYIPPLEQQLKFIEMRSLLYKIIEDTKNQGLQLEDNFNSLMQKAFKGELKLKAVA